LLAAAILPGWRFVRGKFIATIYGGLAGFRRRRR